MSLDHPLLPKHKSDVEVAKRAVQAGYPAVEPILYELLEWIQDANWPVATVVSPFLASIGAPLIPSLRRAMATNDYVWHYWLADLFDESPILYTAFRSEIHRLASSPSAAEHDHELDQRYADVIAGHERCKNVGET